MPPLLKFVHRIATSRYLILMAALWLVFTAVIMPMAQAEIERMASGPSIPDLRFFYTPDQLYGIFDGLTPAARRMYILAELSADICYPLVRELFFSLLLVVLLCPLASARPALRRLALWPFVTLVLDLLENAVLVALVLYYPLKMNQLALLAASLTTLKWAASGITLLLLLSATAFRLWHWAAKPGSPETT